MPCPSIGPKWFWTVQIVLKEYKLFWSGPNHFGQFQIKIFWTNFYNLDLSKMIWTLPKQIVPVQNDWYSTKMILMSAEKNQNKHSKFNTKLVIQRPVEMTWSAHWTGKRYVLFVCTLSFHRCDWYSIEGLFRL